MISFNQFVFVKRIYKSYKYKRDNNSYHAKRKYYVKWELNKTIHENVKVSLVYFNNSKNKYWYKKTLHNKIKEYSIDFDIMS